MTNRPVSPAMEKELGREHKVLDKGFIRLVDYMGTDNSICQAARVSYGAGTKSVSEDRGLIRYLMRHRHTTPFEMCEIKIHVKLPIFVARQWIRNRTANVNEYSARYSIMASEFYVPAPDDVKPQSQTNKQGREGALPEKVRWAMLETIRQQGEGAFQIYDELRTGLPWFDPNGTPWDQYQDPVEMQEATSIAGPENYAEEHGMARELARMVLPMNTYTEWYWKVDLHNLLHFLSLRADPHAQYEIRAYAEVLCDMVRQWVPHAYEAFEDYVMEAETFSRQEMDVIKALVERAQVGTAPRFLESMAAISELSDREKREFLNKVQIA